MAVSYRHEEAAYTHWTIMHNGSYAGTIVRIKGETCFRTDNQTFSTLDEATEHILHA